MAAMTGVLIAILAALVAAVAYMVGHGHTDLLDVVVVLALVVAVLALVLGSGPWPNRRL